MEVTSYEVIRRSFVSSIINASNLHRSNNNSCNGRLQTGASCWEDGAHIEEHSVDTAELLEEHQRWWDVERLEITSTEHIGDLERKEIIFIYIRRSVRTCLYLQMANFTENDWSFKHV